MVVGDGAVGFEDVEVGEAGAVAVDDAVGVDAEVDGFGAGGGIPEGESVAFLIHGDVPEAVILGVAEAEKFPLVGLPLNFKGGDDSVLCLEGEGAGHGVSLLLNEVLCLSGEDEGGER